MENNNTKVIQTLFGEVTVEDSFQHLKPLCECEEEVLEPIIEGLLYKNTYALLSGDKAAYKSWLAGYIAVCVALGQPCFGRPVIKGKVVYIYGEGNMKKRLKRLCRAFGIENTDMIIPYALRADLTDEEMLQDLKNHIPPDTVLVIIDNHEKFWPDDVDAGDVNTTVNLMRDIKEFATVLLLQHNVKRYSKRAKGHHKSRGHGRLINFADSTISISIKGDIVDCEMYVRELEEPPSLCFRLMDNDDESITLVEAVGPTPSKDNPEDKLKRCLSQVRLILKAKMSEPMNKTTIYNHVLNKNGIEGLSSAYFYKPVFPALVEEGSLVEPEESKGKYIYVHKNF